MYATPAFLFTITSEQRLCLAYKRTTGSNGTGTSSSTGNSRAGTVGFLRGPTGSTSTSTGVARVNTCTSTGKQKNQKSYKLTDNFLLVLIKIKLFYVIFAIKRPNLLSYNSSCFCDFALLFSFASKLFLFIDVA